MESITKSVLLKTDPLLQNRPYQIDALLSIFKHQKCLVKMFCGTGKSRIITNVIIHNKKDLSVIVFPSLALINQYSIDYLEEYQNHETINISSEILANVNSTTDPTEIKKFLKLKSPKLILILICSVKIVIK